MTSTSVDTDAALQGLRREVSYKGKNIGLDTTLLDRRLMVVPMENVEEAYDLVHELQLTGTSHHLRAQAKRNGVKEEDPELAAKADYADDLEKQLWQILA